jgi:hypothetical protein
MLIGQDGWQAAYELFFHKYLLCVTIPLVMIPGEKCRLLKTENNKNLIEFLHNGGAFLSAHANQKIDEFVIF